MKEPDVAIYVAVMEEIKRRTTVIHSFLTGWSSAIYRATQVESIYLQIRMILELIALASLAVNKSLFEENQRKFHKHWNPSDILKDIEALNPGYYPKPIREVPSQRKNVVNDLLPMEGGYLTKEELIAFHGRTGNILHAKNPFGRQLDYAAYETRVPSIMEKIRMLLNCHQIQLLGDHDFFYLIHMMEERDDRVHYYKFERVEHPC